MTTQPEVRQPVAGWTYDAEADTWRLMDAEQVTLALVWAARDGGARWMMPNTPNDLCHAVSIGAAKLAAEDAAIVRLTMQAAVVGLRVVRPYSDADATAMVRAFGNAVCDHAETIVLDRQGITPEARAAAAAHRATRQALIDALTGKPTP